MVDTSHAPLPPSNGRVTEVGLVIDGANQQAGLVSPQPPADDAIWLHEKPGDATLTLARIIHADPHVIAGGIGSHRCRDRHVVHGLALFPLIPGHVPQMERVEHQLHPPLFVLPIELRIAIIVTDQHTALDPLDVEGGEMVARTVVFQIEPFAVGSRTAEPLVVSVHNFSPAVDDVETVVRLVPTAQWVGGAENHPQVELPGHYLYLFGALAQQLPGKTLERIHLLPTVAGQTPLRKMDHVGAPRFGLLQLAQYMTEITPNIAADRELAGGNGELHDELRGLCWTDRRRFRRSIVSLNLLTFGSIVTSKGVVR